MKLRKYLDWRHWLKGIWTAGLQGGASAVLGSFGLVGANVVGVDVKPLDYRQFGGVFLSAAVIHILIFLKANPFPEEAEEQIATPSPFPPTQ